jgi:maleylpyruvate isomerase
MLSSGADKAPPSSRSGVSTVVAMDPASPPPDEVMPLVDEATDRVLADVRAMSEADLRAPSGLPGWTRGHVLSHLARNADALGNLFESARTGEQIYAYPSRERRASDIEAGAGRSMAELTADVVASHDAFRSGAKGITDWNTPVSRMAGDPGIPVWWVPLLRLGELEIHHVDLDTGYGIAQWPAAWVRAFLPYAGSDLANRAEEPLAARPDGGETTIGSDDPGARVVSGPPRTLLAWVIGRDDGSGLRVSPDGPLPTLGSWR